MKLRIKYINKKTRSGITGVWGEVLTPAGGETEGDGVPLRSKFDGRSLVKRPLRTDIPRRRPTRKLTVQSVSPTESSSPSRISCSSITMFSRPGSGGRSAIELSPKVLRKTGVVR